MREVSAAWKETNKSVLLPESFVEITLSAIDVEVTGSITCDNEATFSKTSNLINKQNIKVGQQYAFLEHNLWTLDGSVDILPDIASYNPPGYVSENDGDVVLTVSLTKTSIPIPGFTITWNSEQDTYATNFTVDVKSENVTMGSVTVTDNTSNVSLVDLLVSDYDTVVITVHEWSLPERRRRIDSVLFGQKIVFGKDEIMDYSHERSGDPLGAELTQNTIEFSIDNSDDRWNILNPTGLAKYLYNRQAVEVRYGLNVNGNVEWTPAGTFYLSEWKMPTNGIVATFRARDLMEFVLNATFSRAYLEATTTGTTPYYSKLGDVPSDDQVGGTDVSIGTIPKGTTVYLYEYSINQAKSELFGYENNVAVFIGVRAYRIQTTVNGVKIKGWVHHSDVTIPKNGIRFDAQLAVVAGYKGGFPYTYNIDLENAHRPVAIEGTNSAEFLQSCLFSLGLTFWVGSNGINFLSSPLLSQYSKLTDYIISLDLAYHHPEVILAKPLGRLGITFTKEFEFQKATMWFNINNDGDSILIECPWLRDESALANIVNRYKRWWGTREIVSGEFRADPRLDLFDVVTVETKYGKLSPIMITYLKYTYNGSFRAKYEGKAINELAVTEMEE